MAVKGSSAEGELLCFLIATQLAELVKCRSVLHDKHHFRQCRHSTTLALHPLTLHSWLRDMCDYLQNLHAGGASQPAPIWPIFKHLAHIMLAFSSLHALHYLRFPPSVILGFVMNIMDVNSLVFSTTRIMPAVNCFRLCIFHSPLTHEGLAVMIIPGFDFSISFEMFLYLVSSTQSSGDQLIRPALVSGTMPTYIFTFSASLSNRNSGRPFRTIFP